MKGRLLRAGEFLTEQGLLIVTAWVLWLVAAKCIREAGFAGALGASIPMGVIAAIVCTEDWWEEGVGGLIEMLGLCIYYSLQVSGCYWLAWWIAPHLGFEAEFGLKVGLVLFVLRHEVEDFITWRRERREEKEAADDIAA